MEGDAELQDLYREVLIDYYRSTARKGRLDPADIVSEGVNPLCGDQLYFTASIQEGRIGQLRYDGHGCVISQSSAAMLAEAVEGRTTAEAERLALIFKAGMLGRAPISSFPPELEDLKAFEGVTRFPVRIKCALLAWNTLLEALKSWKSGKHEAVQYQEK